MNNDQVSAEIALCQGRPMRLNDAAGTYVRCLRGIIWITVASEPDDVFISAGQSHLIPRNGLSLVEWIDSSSIQLENRRSDSKLNKWLISFVRRLQNGQVL